MKKSVILLVIFVAIIFFLFGYFLNFEKKSLSCADAYNELKQKEICVGRFEEYRGMNEIIGNVEWFQYNWNEDMGSYGVVKKVLIGPNQNCEEQFQRQFIETEIHNKLIDCFVSDISISKEILSIQCGCTFE